MTNTHGGKIFNRMFFLRLLSSYFTASSKSEIDLSRKHYLNAFRRRGTKEGAEEAKGAEEGGRGPWRPKNVDVDFFQDAWTTYRRGCGWSLKGWSTALRTTCPQVGSLSHPPQVKLHPRGDSQVYTTRRSRVYRREQSGGSP